MSIYTDRMNELKLDQSFKSSLLDKMRAQAANDCAEVRPTEDVRAKRDFTARRLAIRRTIISVACAVVACCVIVPVVILSTNRSFSANNLNNSDGNSGGDSSDSTPAQAAIFGTGERATDMYGNYMRFDDVIYSSYVTLDGITYSPAEGNIFIMLPVSLDLTHEKLWGGYIDFTTENIKASYYLHVSADDGGYNCRDDALLFRQDIFDGHFPKVDGRPSGEGVLVFETGEEFADYLAIADTSVNERDENLIVFECSDFGVEGDRQSSIMTTFHLSLEGLIEDSKS